MRHFHIAQRVPRQPGVAAVAACVLVGLAIAASALPPVESLRERLQDALLAGPAPAGGDAPAVAVVDIDRASLAQIGSWPWPRQKLAEAVAAIAAAKPRALGLDMLLLGRDERSPAALARTLARTLDGAVVDPSIREQARALEVRLPDGDAQLADALASVPSVLGLVLDSDDGPAPAAGSGPVLVEGRPDLGAYWQEARTLGAIPALAAAARGAGVLSLPGDADATVRRVPMLVATDTGLVPGLALELARVTADASTFLLGAAPLRLRVGPRALTLPPDGLLRLRPGDPAAHARRTVPLSHVLAGGDARAILAGRIVLLGSSAPELGGLRAAAGGLVPSVQLQADALAQILAGDVPRRPGWLALIEPLVALAVGMAAILAGLRLAPLPAGAVAAALAIAWLAAAVAVLRGPGLLVDPLLVPAVALVGYAGAALTAAAVTRRREALIRRRFEQHLAPAVVERIVANPGLLKLGGESRVVTALFTDIEGFTSMTERAAPHELVALLDRYIDGASRIVVEHGGMLEKIVGDALHVLFNAPLDLEDHARRALDCAEALLAFSECLRTEPDARRLGLGRTRLGIESGRVVVGDVGGGRKLEYTAYGNAMNRAARLEAANKELATSICVGPDAAALIAPERLRPLGRLVLRGVAEPITVREPWPDAMPPGDRQSYLAAMQRIDAGNVGAGIAELQILARAHPGDRSLAALVTRLAREDSRQAT